MIKALKDSIQEIGFYKLLSYVCSITFTMWYVWLISVQDPSTTHYSRYVLLASFSFMGWMYSDTIFLKSFEMVRTLRLYSSLCYVLALVTLFGCIFYKLDFKGILFFGLMGAIFRMNSNRFKVPKHIKDDLRYLTLPKINEIAYISLFYDMLFYIGEREMVYEFRVDVERFVQPLALELFKEDLLNHVDRYADEIKLEKEGVNLVVTIIYHTFDSQKEKIEQLKKDTHYE